MIKLAELFPLLKQAWCKETAMGDRWTPRCRSLDQCAVTALVVQDIYGGALLRCETLEGDSHYWNRLPNGRELDLTRAQFAHITDEPLRDTVIVRDRQYVLSYPDTMYRYGLLLTRLAKLLEEESC